MTHREDLAGYLKVCVAHQARGAETAMHLCRFEDGLVQIGVVLLQLRKLQLEFAGRLGHGTTSRRRQSAFRYAAGSHC